MRSPAPVLAAVWLLLAPAAGAQSDESRGLRDQVQKCWSGRKDMAQCERTVTDVLRRFEELGDAPDAAWTLYMRAFVRESLGRGEGADGDRERSATLFQEALERHASDAPRRRWIEGDYAQLLSGLKDGALRRGDLALARAYAFERLAIAERRGEPGLLAVSHQGVAEVARREGHFDVAAQAYEAAAGYYEQMHHPLGVSACTADAAAVRREAQQRDRLETSIKQAEAPGSEEKAMKEIRFQLRSVFYRNKLKSRPDEVFSVLVREGESFGSVDFGGHKGPPFKLLRVVDGQTAEVEFDKALVIRDFADKRPAVEIVGVDEKKFMTPTTDSGVAVYIRVAP